MVENITQQLDDYYHAILILPIHHWYQYLGSGITTVVPVRTTAVPESCKTLPYIIILVSSKLFRNPASKIHPNIATKQTDKPKMVLVAPKGCTKEGAGYTSDTNN